MNPRYSYYGAVLAAVLMTVGHARGDTVNIGASQDTTIYENQGDLSNAIGNGFFAGRSFQGPGMDIKRGLVQFDLQSAIPPGAIITYAELTLHLSVTSDQAGPRDVSLHLLLKDWGEGTSISPGGGGIGGAATPGDATWTHSDYNTVTWTTTGGDFAFSPSATTTVDDVGYYTWTSSTLTGEVQSWFADPASNRGWIVIGDESTAPTAKKFDSKDNPTPSFRPVLMVEYTPPVPGACACLGDGNYDGMVDSADIGPFIDCVLAGAGPIEGCACMDINGDCLVDQADVDPFVELLKSGKTTCKQEVAACCLPDGSCVLTQECFCSGTLGGAFEAGESCASANCPAPIGACCIYGICYDGFTQPECAAACGTWNGLGTQCAGSLGLCPLPVGGACCLNDQCVPNTTQQYCECNGGVFHGGGATCQSVECAPIGACCIGNACNEGSTEAGCASACGIWLGDGSDCVSAECPIQPTGACCFGAQCVDDMVQAECECFYGGTYHGDGTVCGDAAPFVNCFLGRCCLPNGNCTVTGVSRCESRCGEFQQYGTLCDDVSKFSISMDASQATATHTPTPPAAPATGGGSGSFFLDHGTGVLSYNFSFSGISSAETIAHIHGPAAPGVNGPVVYSLPAGSTKIGSIVLTDPGSYPVAAQIADLVAGFWYVNVHSLQHPMGEIRGQITPYLVPCVPEPTGACCASGFAGQFCTITTECECDQLVSSLYFGDGTVCTPNSCESGACCLPNGECELLTELSCTPQCGEFAGIGVACDEGSLSDELDGNACSIPTGACCIVDSQSAHCEILTECECLQFAQSTYEGDGTDCESTVCVQPIGACCLGDGLCIEQSFNFCNGYCGTWLGASSVCDPGNVCPVQDPEIDGACCLNGSCIDGLYQEVCECSSLNGIWQGDGTTCADELIDCMAGRCCLPDGSCIVATAKNCDDACGVSAPPGTFCNNEVVAAMNMTTTEAIGTHSPPPAPAPTGSGFGAIRLDLNTNELRYYIQFNGLSGPETVSHIHGPAAPGVNAPAVYALPVGQPKHGSLTLTDPGSYPVADQIDDLLAGLWYVNVHTTNHPSGEIRGQLSIYSAPCEPSDERGACCMPGDPDPTCQLLSECECDQIPGSVYFGDGSVCTGTVCLLGACCQPDGTCFNALAEDCTDPCESFQGALNRCDTADCTPTTGACCAGPVCSEVTGCVCSQMGGVYQGDGSDCVPNPCIPQATMLDLACNSLSVYPHVEFVKAFDSSQPVYLAIDPSLHPAIGGVTGDIYVTAAKSELQWDTDPTLTDIRVGGFQTVTFSAMDTMSNTFQIAASGELAFDAGTGLGVGYDVVIDTNQDGMLDPGDYIDGFSDESGFYVVHDLTTSGPLPVETATYFVSGISAPGQAGERVVYPMDIASMGQLPLIVISHGNGQQYTFYEYLQTHLASYGYIVMSHRTNSVAGPAAAAETTLEHTHALIEQQGDAGVANGVLDGHIDSSRIIWIGQGRGGEGVVRAYNDLFTGAFTSAYYDAGDILLVSSIAPTDVDLGNGSPDLADPLNATYHLLYGAADGIVDGCADNDDVQPFNVYDRCTGTRQATYVQGVGHNDFNCCGFNDASGPSLLGRADAQAVAKSVYLALVKHYADGNIPASEFLWRQYESLRTSGAPVGAVVDRQYRRGLGAGRVVIDDYQSSPSTSLSSSGGMVTFDVLNVYEGLMNDSAPGFTWTSSDPMNGMTMAGDDDSSAGVVFDWSSPGSYFYELEVVPAERDFTDDGYISLRAAQGTQHPETLADVGDLSFTVTLRDGMGTTSSIAINAFGGGIEEPYARIGVGAANCGPNPGWANEFETIRIRLTDFLRDGSGLDLSDVVAVRLEFGGSHGSARGRIGLDDIELTQE
ncbi:MAG: CHRD domain-containing protein [Phycisphaerales bacterium]|nr:CHRD domain-containing protein [Phycisphaerales bacterium]MCB9854753.1 CHRD domain-containing protein [Phycisphaerales bacterium]MCB9863775.1 CHRD domain-containing protein [Phycisphaerales bacterium]